MGGGTNPLLQLPVSPALCNVFKKIGLFSVADVVAMAMIENSDRHANILNVDFFELRLDLRALHESWEHVLAGLGKFVNTHFTHSGIMRDPFEKQLQDQLDF